MDTVPEAHYPVTFRESDTRTLGDLISHHTSAVLIGMKRVGINNFLRFFLTHPTTRREYVTAGGNVMYIHVDLNDLVEREIYPFWILVLKRISDMIDQSPLSQEIKTKTKHLFTEAIQLKDLFVTVDSVQKILTLLSHEGISPVMVLIRFDRLTAAITPEFFHNLQGLKDATGQKLTYIFTSYRPLYELVPKVFTKASLSVFSQDLYLLPAGHTDSQAILNSFCTRYKITLSPTITQELLRLSAGHVQYMQLALLKIKEKSTREPEKLEEALINDDQIILQSEELYENLNPSEQEVLSRIARKLPIAQSEKETTQYLWKAGIITKNDTVFSPLFAHFVLQQAARAPIKNHGEEFTKKELALITCLRANIHQVVERDDIVVAVWPEVADLSVSDWAIDRLVSRVRTKLRLQKSPEKIVTVVTRGYKLVNK